MNEQRSNIMVAYWHRAATLLAALLFTFLSTHPAAALPLVTTAANAPGTILTQGAPTIDTGITEASSVRSITYATRDIFGNERVSSGIIAVPKGVAPASGWPVIANAHYTVGVADLSAPSSDANGDGLSISRYNAWLKAGYAIASSDYAGLGTAGVMHYLNGKETAYNVIDSVRALRNAFPGAVSTKYVSTGWSQGGHASLFVGRYSNEYAPELELRGSIAICPATNIERFLPLASPIIPPLPLEGFITYMVYLFAGVNDTYPDMNFSQYLTPLGIELMNASQTISDVEMYERTKTVGLGQLFSKNISPEHLALIRDYMGVPTTGYTKPVHVIQGLTDLTVPAAITALYTTEMLVNLQPIDISEYLGNHVGTYTASQVQEQQLIDKYFGKKQGLLGLGIGIL